MDNETIKSTEKLIQIYEEEMDELIKEDKELIDNIIELEKKRRDIIIKIADNRSFINTLKNIIENMAYIDIEKIQI